MEDNDDHSDSSALDRTDESQPEADVIEEVVVYLAEGRALVIGRDTEERSRWGRLLDSRPSAEEFRTLVHRLDQATRAYVESQAWIGRYVELDPLSRSMWGDGFKTFTDENGWSQANLRNEETSKYARLMRVRRLDGVANVANVTAVLGALAAQSETAEVAQTLSVISNRVSEVAQHQKTDQIGAAENAVEQVAGVILRLREHGLDAVHESDFSTVRNSLGDARRKALGHLRDAVTTLDDLSGGSPADFEKALGQDGTATVALYFDLLGQLHLAGIQLELGQVAVYLLQGKSEVAATWTAHITASAEEFRGELDAEVTRINALDAAVRGQFQSAWKHALRPGERAKEATAGASLAAGATVKKFVGNKTISVGPVTVNGNVLVAGAAAAGAVVGFSGTQVRNAFVQPRAQRSVGASLQELVDKQELSFAVVNQARPSLELLRSVAGELTAASDAIDLPD